MKDLIKIPFFAVMVCFSILFFAFHSEAKKDGTEGVTADAGIGYPRANIDNPDDTVAGYGGIAVMARGFTPLFSVGSVSMNFHGALRYYDYHNDINSGKNQEIVNEVGGGAGLSFRFGRPYIGAEYLFMKTRHFLVGDNSNHIEYKFTPVNAFVGVNIPFSLAAIGISYERATGTIKKSESKLSEDSKYKDESVWLHFVYDFDFSLGEFIGKIFK